jgi:hypothetical protein
MTETVARETPKMAVRAMTEAVQRDTQADAVLLLLREAREMGWSEVTVEVTRGGTVKVTGKAEGGKVAGHQWGTGRK